MDLIIDSNQRLLFLSENEIKVTQTLGIDSNHFSHLLQAFSDQNGNGTVHKMC